MKKVLIPALLLASAALASSQQRQFAARVSELTEAVTGPLARALFWQLCDEFLTRRFAPSSSNVPREPEAHRAILSIPLCLVRRTVEREVTTVREHPANHRRDQYQVNSQFKEMSS